jgi:hypothetical protein
VSRLGWGVKGEGAFDAPPRARTAALTDEALDPRENSMSRTDKDLPHKVAHVPRTGPLAEWCWLCPFRRAPRWAKLAAWTRPDRMSARVLARRAAVDFNTNGDTDIDPVTDYHHHTTDGRW